MAERPTLTILAPAGILADLKAAGYRGPYAADHRAHGLLVDQDGHAVVPIGPSPNARGLSTKLAETLAIILNGLEAEHAAITAPLDPPHIAAVEQQSRERNAVSDFSRRLVERVVQSRQAGE